MTKNIEELEEEMREAPTPQWVINLKILVGILNQEKANTTKLKSELDRVKLELDTRPPKGTEPEQVQPQLITLQELHNKIAEANKKNCTV